MATRPYNEHRNGRIHSHPFSTCCRNDSRPSHPRTAHALTSTQLENHYITIQQTTQYTMNAKTIAAAALIIVGIFILAYSGISFTTPGETIRFLGLKFETREVHYISPLMGGLAVLGGIGLLVYRRSSV